MNNKNITFEEIITELENISLQLEKGSMPLNKAVQSYTKGIELKSIADKQLKDAYLQLQSVQENKEISKFREQTGLLFSNLKNMVIKSLDNDGEKIDIDSILDMFKEDFKNLYIECSNNSISK